MCFSIMECDIRSRRSSPPPKVVQIPRALRDANQK